MAEDKTLVCKDCGQQFTFTTGEQEFYAQKGFQNEPVRCGACRRARKQQRAATSGVQFRDREQFGGSSFRSGNSGFGRSQY